MAKIYSFSNAILKTKVLDEIDKLRKRLQSPEVMEPIGQKMVTLIQGRTRSGLGADGSPLKPLSPSYIEARKGLKKTKIKTGRFFKPEQSNLTVTGQMVDSIKYEVGDGFARAFIDDSKKRNDGQSNKTIADKVASEGREFMGLTEQDNKTINRMVEREANRIVRELIRGN